VSELQASLERNKGFDAQAPDNIARRIERPERAFSLKKGWAERTGGISEGGRTWVWGPQGKPFGVDQVQMRSRNGSQWMNIGRGTRKGRPYCGCRVTLMCELARHYNAREAGLGLGLVGIQVLSGPEES